MTERIVTLEGPVAHVPRPREVDAIMEEVSRQLGETWVCARLSGVWVFKRGTEAGITSRRRFPNALADCLRVGVAIKN